MTRQVYIGSAWPYVNGDLHLGHVAALVPADFLARYHRLKGDHVLWTSGSDCHGTPITERARKEGVTPREVAERFHTRVFDTFQKLGFSYSLYWATMKPNHVTRVQESFLALWNKGLIIESDFSLARCETCNDNRADREVNGECPVCHAAARGDQCDACGRTSNPNELVNPTCSTCGKTVTFTNTRELFLDLPKLEPELKAWVSKQTHWRENAKRLTMGWLQTGLEPRCISRDIDWGVPVPLAGWEHRRIYVWFEAVHGYLTASMEWALQSGNPDAWKPFWDADNPNTLHYYVIGKDNTPFHSLVWPFILMGKGLALPWHIVSSEYLGLEGKQFSTSRNFAIWTQDFLTRYDPDLLRYFLTVNGPEKNDTDFTWEQFVTRVNGELVDNYSNLVHRVLSFIERKLDGKIPSQNELMSQDQELIDQVTDAFVNVGTQIEQTEFRQAMETILLLVQATNRYLQTEAPWKTLQNNMCRTQTVLRVALHVIDSLSVLTEPFLPFQAKRLRAMLDVSTHSGWAPPERISIVLNPVSPLFFKLDPKLIKEEQARLKAQSAT